MTTDMLVEHLPRVATGTSNMVSGTSMTVFYPGQHSKSYDTTLYQVHKLQELVTKCPYFTGDIVRPVENDKWAADGAYKIVGIATSLAEWRGTDYHKPWPADDNPLIVEAYNLTTGATIHATTNYFQSLAPHEKGIYK